MQPGEVTVLLRQLGAGDRSALDRLVELIYPELRRLARRHLRDERAGHVLQPTALVNEVYVRLVGHEQHCWANRSHFFGAAARLMRRILVDYARAERAQKRGGGHVLVPLDVAAPVLDGSPVDFVSLDEALDALARVSSRQAQIVELRYFGGLTVAEVAEALQMNARTVDRDWAIARAWLRRRLQG